MNKKFAVVKIYEYYGTYIRVMGRDDFETLSHSAKWNILFESDNYTDVSNKFQEYKSAFDDITHV